MSAPQYEDSVIRKVFSVTLDPLHVSQTQDPPVVYLEGLAEVSLWQHVVIKLVRGLLATLLLVALAASCWSLPDACHQHRDPGGCRS